MSPFSSLSPYDEEQFFIYRRRRLELFFLDFLGVTQWKGDFFMRYCPLEQLFLHLFADLMNR